MVAFIIIAAIVVAVIVISVKTHSSYERKVRTPSGIETIQIVEIYKK